jgi:hypothetical protein
LSDRPATFDVSGITNIALSQNTSLGAMVFKVGANAYSFTAPSTGFINPGFTMGGAVWRIILASPKISSYR